MLRGAKQIAPCSSSSEYKETPISQDRFGSGNINQVIEVIMESILIIGYFVAAIIICIVGCVSVSRADKQGRRNNSPTRTDELQFMWILISFIWPVLIPFIYSDYLSAKARKRRKDDAFIFKKYGVPLCTNKGDFAFNIRKSGRIFAWIAGRGEHFVRFVKKDECVYEMIWANGKHDDDPISIDFIKK